MSFVSLFVIAYFHQNNLLAGCSWTRKAKKGKNFTAESAMDAWRMKIVAIAGKIPPIFSNIFLLPNLFN